MTTEDSTRLNKYLAHCGIASRRASAEIIKAGHVAIDGVTVYDIGYRVQQGNVVTYKGKVVEPLEEKVYILLNKPKDTVTTAKDERGRKTVIDIIQPHVNVRIYPVGRLDRNTTGLLLLTNDGDLAQRLSHPGYRVKKIYHVVLDRALESADLEAIRSGVLLDDGIAEVDQINTLRGEQPTEVGLELHSGRNRIIRRIFEHQGYQVQRLDRVYYAGLTKKNLPRGRWRHLSQREVIMLKHFV